MNNVVYVDHSATTYVKKEVLKEMLPYFYERYGNASSIYSLGRQAKQSIDQARKNVANLLGAKSTGEIYFTAGGSESDNLAIKGIARANKSLGRHIITSKIEHLAVINSCKQLEEEGFEVTYLDVNDKGLIDIKDLLNAIRNDTILISIMFANNEIGTIQPIEEIGKIARENGIIFHTDAVQAIGNVKIDVQKLNIDAMSLSAHKFYGPKGVGALYLRKEVKFNPIIAGGHQEKNKRAGTENVAGIVGLSKAIEIAYRNIDVYNKKLLMYRNMLLEYIKNNIKDYVINGSLENRLPGNVNVAFKGVEAEALLTMLDIAGICASSGSACNSAITDPSHVLTALKLRRRIYWRNY